MVNLGKQKETTNEVITKTIDISTVNAVKNFVEIACHYNCCATLVSGRFAIDAKSIMGVFSLDVSKPIDIEIEIGKNGEDDREAFIAAIDEYIVKE